MSNRRDFLKKAGGLALLTIVPRSVLGGTKFVAPSDQLTKGIIGVGGIMTPDDAKAMLDAGADLLQLYTGYIYNGPGLVRDICRALIADAEAKAAAERAAAAQATAEQPAVQQAAAEQPAKEQPATKQPSAEQAGAEQPAPQSAETQPEAENAEPAPAESRTPAQSGPDSEQPES